MEMAYHLCSSPSSLLHDRQTFCSSVCSSHKLKVRAFTHSNKVTCLGPQSRTLLHVNHVSLQEPIAQATTEDVESMEEENCDDTVAKSTSSKSYIWVNPRSPRAKQLLKRSYDARYSFLVKTADSLNSCSPNEQEVSKILRGLGDKILEQDAVVVLNNMENPETAPVALKLFQQRIKPTREVILYNVTMKVFRKCREYDKAEKLFDEMLEKGVKPDNVTFSTIISCARMCSMPMKAVEWFEKMPSFGCVPDDVTYSAIIDAYGRAGNVDMALSLYDRARTEKWRIDTVTFSTLIKMYGISGNYDGCLNVYEEMKALGAKLNMVVYNTLLDAMGRAKRPWQAKNIYREMINNGFTPNFATYASLLRAYCRSRYSEDALNVYKEMKANGMELNMVLYNTLLAMCADVGCAEEAVEIFEDMKNSGTCKPDSWTFSSLITIYSCSGQVVEAEAMLNEMIESGFEPNIFVLTSLVQCYGKAKRTDDVVKTFYRLLDLGIVPDDRFCGCLLNVMTLVPKEELGKLTDCVDKANPKLGSVVRYLVEDPEDDENFRKEASELFDSIDAEVKKAFCNCLIDLCVNLNKLERASELLDMGLSLQIYTDIQSRSQTQWALHLKSLSLGAAFTALHVWINDLSKTLESGEDLPPLLGINTGHGKHKYSDKGLASVLESHLKEMGAPFHEAPDQAGWFLTTQVAAKSWLESRKSPELIAA
ncbi:pentatricopeptide repeat-containing protein At4g16390, chloroplastic-like [Neltuma alba]|uniref:pentatricopeptide repeat-containing protein At4g16390, chloroplastic-like n=1 Tax=Neltuma alba TaxID=207710 RepID=UPI0010A38E15|nr:pentatricopeptide repeat-containing protein At4g16390, chloroplastic-like [Prosopis alba]XP_028769001.1 pentatricopeptide repeat-containing protein At4g16390, chloroplastic-like [Prosopis alba]